jgi:hypothetical protein
MKRPKAAFLLSSGFYLTDSMTVEGAFANRSKTSSVQRVCLYRSALTAQTGWMGPLT